MSTDITEFLVMFSEYYNEGGKFKVNQSKIGFGYVKKGVEKFGEFFKSLNITEFLVMHTEYYNLACINNVLNLLPYELI